MLRSIYNDFSSHTCKEIHLIWTDGRKGGIGNPAVVKLVMDTIIKELERQINEE